MEDTSAFALEKYLEEFIVSYFPAIFKRELEIYEDAEGNDGQQHETERLLHFPLTWRPSQHRPAPPPWCFILWNMREWAD